jgi:nicotinamide mononucleotide transporter
LVVQIIAFTLSPTNFITLLGGLCGATCVVLIAKGKVINYYFGFVSSIIILASALQAKVFAEIPLQIFFMVVDIVSLYVWYKVSPLTRGSVKKARSLNRKNILSVVFLLLGFFLAANGVITLLGDPQPIIDAVTFSIGATAMILLLFQFRENFWFWMLANICSIILWFKAGQYIGGNYALFVMYILYFCNSLYGTINWFKMSKKEQ